MKTVRACKMSYIFANCPKCDETVRFTDESDAYVDNKKGLPAVVECRRCGEIFKISPTLLN